MPRPRKLSEKQEATLEKMRQTRIDDGIALRKALEEKLNWAKLEVEKGKLVLEKQLQQIQENKLTMQKLSAVIDVLTDILKEKIRDRDNHECQLCNKKEIDYYRKLDVHHIDYNKEHYNENNLITLCQICHLKTNFNRDYWFAYCRYIIENIIKTKYENSRNNRDN